MRVGAVVCRRATPVLAALGAALLASACVTGAPPPGDTPAGVAGWVTVAEWNRCTGEGVCPFRIDGPADAPATEVSWDDAQIYLTWLSGRTGRSHRLPTLTEWTPTGGEIAEWLQDCHTESDAPPGEPCSHRLIRPMADYGAYSPSLRMPDVGFRIARDR